MKFIIKPWFLILLVVTLVIIIVFLIPVEKRQYGLSEDGLTTDYSGLIPQKIAAIEKASNRQQLVEIIKEANMNGKKVSIAGVQHSQGGHTYYKDGIVIDMKSFNKILKIDKKNKQVRVEAGAVISDIQKAVVKEGLAMQVSQSLPIFSIGGSLSVNGHGRDIRYGSMASTVDKMTIITPTGQLKKLTKKEHAEQMALILGGYGLFGVIVDVTLNLTNDEIYKYESKELQVSDYESYLKNVLSQPEIAMHYARLSVDRKHFLQDMYAMNYYKTGEKPTTDKLKEESLIHLSKWGLDLGRQGGASETLFWNVQKKLFATQSGNEITRNNAMRSESTFMEYTKSGSVEVLQEFFIPIDDFNEFIDDLKKWLPADDADEVVKLHNITLRILLEDKATKMNYAREPMIAFVLLIQHPTSEKGIDEAKTYIQKWTDTALNHNGTYYLPYYPYQTIEQFKKAYPQAQQLKMLKDEVDPNHILINNFYENYLQKVDE